MVDPDASQTRPLHDRPTDPLRIERVVPPEPHHGAGTYDVQLEVSRPLTRHEVRAAAGPGPCRTSPYRGTT